ncbi:preQ(1) synthase [Helicobacter trogontum]|uniref:NADPH-dependent 7-cyano-7-deazaguanine reductase n=1 Tax=Helicobacter trogontum TaxID=50960 RepID=A0A4U8SAH7_9HELI|nr:preQ(1) synthase [Helicobacter trogontum]TLD83073.1 NADPH-dependent 7-cyano-7-deazaguanine reductase QueF [Helicobacter trogontum]
MAKQKEIQYNLKQLGKETAYTFSYDPSVLESVPNPHPQRDYFIKFNCPEFTSLCPITAQPDFATIYISYIADKLIVESKSLKLYLFSFRNHGGFHEDCVNTIADDLIRLLSPRYLEVWGKFTPRGGLSIDPYVNYGRENSIYAKLAKKRLWLHDLYPETITNR